MDQAYVQVTTTIDSRDDAAALARSAVEERLAASAQLIAVHSTYWWDDEIESADEWMVLFKTTADRFEDLAALINEQHTYDTPEIMATPVVAGSADYLNWVREQTADDDTEESDLDDDLEDLDLLDETPEEPA